jgi:hypothetical protein
MQEELQLTLARPALICVLSIVTIQDEASQCTGDGTLDINDQTALKQRTGNWRACFMILGRFCMQRSSGDTAEQNLLLLPKPAEFTYSVS